MKIAIIGTQNNGKSTLIEEFKKTWPMYKQPEKTYRDFIAEKGIKHSQEGTKESQRDILNAIVDESQHAIATGDEHIIFDRCAIDNIAYTLWLNQSGEVSDEFVIDSKHIAMEAIKLLDIIFYLPLREEIKMKPREGRSDDPVYREEIDNIFRALVGSYEKQTGAFFSKEDSPAVITLEGPPDMRCQQIKLYVKDNGKFFDEKDGSLLS